MLHIVWHFQHHYPVAKAHRSPSLLCRSFLVLRPHPASFWGSAGYDFVVLAPKNNLGPSRMVKYMSRSNNWLYSGLAAMKLHKVERTGWIIHVPCTHRHSMSNRQP